MTAAPASIEIDGETDVRLREIAARRGQSVSEIVAEAVALLDFIAAADQPDVAEDRRSLDQFMRTGLGVSFEAAEAWVQSWGSSEELPRPQPRKMR